MALLGLALLGLALLGDHRRHGFGRLFGGGNCSVKLTGLQGGAGVLRGRNGLRHRLRPLRSVGFLPPGFPGDFRLLLRQGLAQRIRQLGSLLRIGGLLRGLLLKLLLGGGGFPGLVGQRADRFGLRLERFRTRIRPLAKLLPQGFLHPLLLLAPVGRNLLRLPGQIRLGLPREFALLLCQFGHPRKILDPFAVALDRLANRFQLCEGVIGLLACGIDLRLALGAGILKRHLFGFLAGGIQGLGGLTDVIGLGRVDAFIHPLRQFVERLTRLGKLGGGLLKLLARFLRQFVFAHFAPLPVHPVARLAGIADRLLDAILGILLLLAEFLPHQ